MKKPLTSLDFCYSGECENISVQETFPAKFIFQFAKFTEKFQCYLDNINTESSPLITRHYFITCKSHVTSVGCE
jgi:hypothetical protein